MKVIAAIGMFLVPAGAGAQDVGKFARNDDREFRSDVSAEMGRCLVSRDRKHAIDMVRALDDDAFAAARKRVSQEMIGCLHGRVSATLDYMHTAGAVAEALLAENDGSLLVKARSLEPVSAFRVTVSTEVALAAMGCASAADPTDAVDLLRAPAESSAEMTAFRKLLPSVQACVPATGAVVIKPRYVRAMTAVTTYRHATAGAAGGVQ